MNMRPETEAELAGLIAGRDTPLWIRGGGTAGVVPDGADVLETSGLAGISLYEPGALTLVVKAGTPLAEVEGVLAAEGQRLAFEPADLRGVLGASGEPTIGAVAAMNVSGPRRIQAGACRDFMLGVRYVDGLGTIVKNGGRVMKNVTGYDLVKLMSGACGTLGVLTEVSMKVLPMPEAQGCVMVDGLAPDAAVQAMSAALGSPYDVTGAAHLPEGVDGAPVTMVRVEGFGAQVDYRTGKLRDLLGRFGDVRVETDAERVTAGWRYVRDLQGFVGVEGDLWRISVKPSDGAAVLTGLNAVKAQMDWGGGLIWAVVPAGTDVRSRMGVAGHATLVRGTGQPRFHPETPVNAQLAAGLRAKFDPKGMFNPGLMGAY